MSGGIGRRCDGSGHSADARRWSCRPGSAGLRNPNGAAAANRADPDAGGRRPGREPRARAREDRRRGAAGRARRVPAGAVPLPLLLPERGHAPASTSPSRSRARAREALGEARREREIAIVASLFEQRAPRASTTTPRSCSTRTAASLGIYRKMHIPDDPLYYEKFYFTPGDLGFRAFARAARDDRRRSCAGTSGSRRRRGSPRSRGAQILFYPTAIGWQFDEGEAIDTAQHDAWETVQRGHAIANGVFVAAVNRVGREDGIRFWGQSFVADPFGRVLARASADREETLLVDCDLGAIEAVRRNWPFLRDRRIDAYGDLMQPQAGASAAATVSLPPALRWPAEWEPHAATWLAWPHDPDTWPGHLAEAQRRVRRDRARARRAASASSCWSRDARWRRRAREQLAARRRRPDARRRASTTCRPTTPGCATRSDLRRGRTRGDAAARSTSASTRGAASTRPGISTTRSARRSRSARGVPRATSRASCSRAARSTATARARCSPPSRAC